MSSFAKLASFITLAALAVPALGHIEMKNPPPLRSSFNPQYKDGPIQDTYTNPLKGDGSNFPCKGFHTDVPSMSHAVATLNAGSNFTVDLAGSAVHGGGSCQFSVSYDGAKTFGVLHSIVGGCPTEGASYQVPIPADLPSGKDVIFAWTWFNYIGNREIYMNCAAVDVLGSNTGAIELPRMFEANHFGLECTTPEGANVDFAAPVLNNCPADKLITPDMKVTIGSGSVAPPSAPPTQTETDTEDPCPPEEPTSTGTTPPPSGGANKELRSDPAYLSYYYSNVNLNPRLPPPLLSKEDWRFQQRLKGGSSGVGGIGDRRKGNMSEFSTPPGFNFRKQERSEVDAEKPRGSAEWGGDGLIGLPGLGLRNKQKSLAEIFQDDMEQRPSFPSTGLPSRPASRNAFDENVDVLNTSEAELTHVQGSSATQNIGLPTSYSYAAALGGSSLSRSTTPDPQHVARAPSPCLTPIGGGRSVASDKRGIISPDTFNGVSSGKNESADLVAALSGMNLSAGDENHLPSQVESDVDNHQRYLFGGMQGGQDHGKQHAYLKKSESGHLQNSVKSRSGSDLNNLSLHRQVELQNSSAPNNSYFKGSPTSHFSGGGNMPAPYQGIDGINSSFTNYGLSGYAGNPALTSLMTNQYGTGNLPPLFENVAAASAMASPGMDSRFLGVGLASGAGSPSDVHSLGRMGNQIAGGGLQAPFVDPMYLQYMRTSEYAAQLAALNDPSADRNYLGNSYMNLLELQKAYLGSVLSPQKSQYNVPLGGKSANSNHQGYYGNPTYGVGLSYPGSPMANSASPVASGSPIRHNDLNMRFASGMRNLAGVMGPWHVDTGNMDESFASSLLEEFKSNKAKCFELSEIAGHVVEFSADQYGSRFIQQKLETATTEEKNMVYQEIMPHALVLMTDVFGNYVVQKFFEHGLGPQRRELANKLLGHVLTLSLQMYGCRVIQKAIEVVDLDQKIEMVQELDGNIMRCVRDQNGNHVIQKCIECVPEDAIDFIVSTFFDQVVTLSTHPYGCRVIQRVLEHCESPATQQKVMDEILSSVSMLAQDQYGNYVVQHVLEHGKPHERSTIIKELAGRIVQMSQQKFASNVVEKCLTFSGPLERQILVSEMLGTTDENEPLQAMMKDQFANYVVQKVLETCDDHQRELILSRIKVHLNALKKYTYGKHIVARVEKLVAAGERRIAAQTPQPA